MTLLANALPGTTPGIDISHWNGNLTKEWWSTAFDEGYRFVFLKATDGRSFKDPNFEANKANARAAGFKIGAYCFARPRSSGIEQAEFFISVAGELDLGGVWDLEDDGGMVDWVINKRTEEFLSTLNSHYGYSWMYSASWFLDPRQINPQVPYYRWVAHWTSATSPFLPRIWRDREYDAWQHSSTETVAGKNPVDANRMQKALYEKLTSDNDNNDDLVDLRVKQETIDDLKRALSEH
jgi:GH25 family lysozyme M1 (1,4-beta-N-acetylmuramidase)